MIPNKPSEEFKKANVMLRKGQYEEAIKIYDNLIQISKNGEDFDFNFIVDLYRIFSNKGTALKKLNRSAEAVEAYTLALDSGGHIKPSVYQMRAEAHQMNGNLDAAIADLETSLGIDPNSNVGLWNIVCLSGLNKDIERVVKYICKFAEIYAEEVNDLIKDSDLMSVRDDPEFKKAISEL